jgi:hypothetical protein
MHLQCVVVYPRSSMLTSATCSPLAPWVSSDPLVAELVLGRVMLLVAELALGRVMLLVAETGLWGLGLEWS